MSNIKILTFAGLCRELSISEATGRNWLRLDKLTPTEYVGGEPVFSEEYLIQLTEKIRAVDSSLLKSRRNKSFAAGTALYKAYVSDTSCNISAVQRASASVKCDEESLRMIIAECAVQLIAKRFRLVSDNETGVLEKFINGKINLGKRACLVENLISRIDFSKRLVEANECFFYEAGEDILGLLYMSCKSLSDRKHSGAYFTPSIVAKQLIGRVFGGETVRGKILDPSCGTGNFLLQLNAPPENIYGIDLDEISVGIARINLALKYPDCDLDVLYKNMNVCDYLKYPLSDFDYIIGNPPWGYAYNDLQKAELRDGFTCAVSSSIESYDIFVEHSLSKLANGGVMAFVLPEAILNVKAHKPIRKYIECRSKIISVDFLGNAFDGVQCPSIILQLTKSNTPFSLIGTKISISKYEYTIQRERAVTSDGFSLKQGDEDYALLEKISTSVPCVYLKGNADFALGIVTGDNKTCLSDAPFEGSEPILRGTDICKYHILPAERFIRFDPQRFQQTASEKMYRAPEKLLYRFIGGKLIFAYDDRGILSLNSCNLLVPYVKNMDIKYIMAVLNSRVAQFWFSMKYHSLKVLRSHIEQIPIPMADISRQSILVSLADGIASEHDEGKRLMLYNEIDENISRIYGIGDKDYQRICRSQKNEKIFL